MQHQERLEYATSEWVSPPNWIRYSTPRSILRLDIDCELWKIWYFEFLRGAVHIIHAKLFFFQCKTWLKVSWKWMVWKNLFLTCYMRCCCYISTFAFTLLALVWEFFVEMGRHRVRPKPKLDPITFWMKNKIFLDLFFWIFLQFFIV